MDTLATLTKLEKSEEFIEILEPLESMIASFYREHEKLNDHDVLKIYEALAKQIKARLTNFPLPQHNLNDVLAPMYALLLEFIETQEEDYTLEEIQACIKMLIKSVKKWTELRGSTGYLTFISRFFLDIEEFDDFLVLDYKLEE